MLCLFKAPSRCIACNGETELRQCRELEDIRYTRRRPHVKIAEQFLIVLMTNSYRVSQYTDIMSAYNTDAA